MLLRKPVLDAIAAGEVDLAFRRWRRPTVKSGGTLRTPVGLVRIETVDRIAIGEIDASAAIRAGTSLDELIAFLEAKGEGDIYRVEFGGVVSDPLVALREDDDLGPEEVNEIRSRLARLDNASRRGPWTEQFLTLLAENPHVRAQDLADVLGLEKTVFKNDVRKLKALGLTMSHSPGYELSPRGRMFFEHLSEGER